MRGFVPIASQWVLRKNLGSQLTLIGTSAARGTRLPAPDDLLDIERR